MEQYRFNILYLMKDILLPFLLLFTITCTAQTDTSEIEFAVSKVKDSTIINEPFKAFTFVEQPPYFPNGDAALMDTIRKNLQYPAKEKQDGVKGSVIVRFIIDEQGNVILPVVMRGISATLDAEAIRVVSALPKFKPGKQQGKPVKVYYTVPISFR